MASEKTIGIDLGTTNSVVAVMEGGQPKVIPNELGERVTPSVVAFTDDNPTGLVGRPAKNQAVLNPRDTVYSIKRFMGRRGEEATEEERSVPFEVVGGPSEYVRVKVRGKEYSPPEISARILQYLKKAAEAYLGQEIENAVITVPAYFNDAQRQATKDAGRVAGLEVKRIINEPTASSLAYGLENKENAKIAVYDFGGGTFDISVLEVGDGVFEVLSTAGDTFLGGDDFDRAVMGYLIDEFRNETGIDLKNDPTALQRLRDAAEKAKIDLSSRNETEINLLYLAGDESGPKHLVKKINRAKLESLIKPLVEKTRRPCEQAMSDAGLKPGDINEIVLVGGSTRVPLVIETVKDIFGKDPNRSVNPDEVVALGAAIQAGVLTGEVSDILLLDVTPLTLGVETLGGVMTPIIPRNTTIPTRKAEVFSTAQDNQSAVDIHVLQGERKMAQHNRTLGRFTLTGIPPAPRGIPQIEVTFNIDADGILHVSAKDKATGKEQSIEIKASSGLDENEIEKMVEDAEEHKVEDERLAKLADARNQADSMVYNMEKTIKEHGDQVPEEDRQKVVAALERLKELKDKSQDPDEINKAIEELMQSSHKLAEILYQKASAQQGAQVGGDTGSDTGSRPGSQASPESGARQQDGEEVVDAEYRVVDEDEKK